MRSAGRLSRDGARRRVGVNGFVLDGMGQCKHCWATEVLRDDCS